MSIKPIVLFAFLCCHAASLAQSITGLILNDENNPIPYATVAIIQKSDSVLYKGDLTNEQGAFRFDQVKMGIYYLKISSVGYATTYSAEIKMDSLSHVALPVVLIKSGNELNEIAVSAIRKTIEFKDGNVTVNVENSVLAKGNTVYDLLLKLPGVSIDNNTIALNGRTGVTVMLDGRVQQLSDIQLMNMLRSMNAEVVEKIELLKNPPVKYDASGTSGMIHIRTKKTKITGFSGSVYSTYSQGMYARAMGGTALNYKSKNVVFFSSVDGSHSYYGAKQQFNRLFVSDTAVTRFENYRSSKDREKELTLKIGMDWQPHKKSTVGFKIDGGPGSYDANGWGINTVSEDNYMGYDHLNSFTYGPYKWTNMNYNLNAEHRFDTSGTVLNVAFDYSQLKETVTNFIENYFLDVRESSVLPPNIYKTDNTASSNVFTFKTDFTKGISETASLETGAKMSIVRIVNDYDFKRVIYPTGEFVSDTSLSNAYRYDEQTVAGYFNYKKTLHKLTMQLGLRVEHTLQEGKNTGKGFALSRNYLNLFPNFSFEYKASDKHSWQLNLNRRIDRPAFYDLSPFRIYFDQYYYYQGNPFLQPHYSYATELTHRFGDLFSHSFTSSYIDHVMTDYNTQDDATKLQIESKKNMNFQKYLAYSFFLQHELRKWWSVSFNGLLHNIEYSGDLEGIDFRTKLISYSIFANNTFVAGKKTKLELNGFYKSGLNTGISQMHFIWMVSLAVKQSFLKDKLDISIGINDLFKSLIARSSTNFSNQHWNYRYVQDSRRLTLTLNYNFGKLKIDQRSVEGNEEEKERLNH